MKTSSTFQGVCMSETYIVQSITAAVCAASLLLSFASAQAKPAAVAKKPARKMMVPPPPPNLPVIRGHGAMEFSTIGVPLDFMAREDLERMQVRLKHDLEILSRKAEERRTTLAECKARVAQFDQLYVEGVVSKKDLKMARKELTEAEETDIDVDQRLADVKSDLARVEKRLQAMSRKNTSSEKEISPQAARSTLQPAVPKTVTQPKKDAKQ